VLGTIRAEQAQLDGQPHWLKKTLKQNEDVPLEQVLKRGFTHGAALVVRGSRKVLKLASLVNTTFLRVVFHQIQETHQDQSIYTQPERFDPERFSPERSEDKQKNFSHIPFVVECGRFRQRVCWLEMKLFAVLLVREHECLLPRQNLQADGVTIFVPVILKARLRQRHIITWNCLMLKLSQWWTVPKKIRNHLASLDDLWKAQNNFGWIRSNQIP